MPVGTTDDIDPDFEIDMSEAMKYSTPSLSCNTYSQKSPVFETQETIENMTSSSCSYSSLRDPSRSHLRLKMSSGSSKQGLGLQGGWSSMTIPSLLQKLPCHGSSTKPSEVVSSVAASPASAVTLSALSVIEKGSEPKERQNNYVIQGNGCALSSRGRAGTGTSTFNTDFVNLDSIDLDNIPIGDLQALQAADGETLHAKYLNKLSPKEREYVEEDIHGVADDMDETNNSLFLDDSLMKFQEEVNNELILRRAENNFGNYGGMERKDIPNDKQQEQNSASTWKPEVGTPKLPALEERLGKLQEKLDELVRERNNLNNSVNGVGDFPLSKQLSAKNHPMFGKLCDIGSSPFGSNSGANKSKSNVRPTAVPSSCFGGSSSFFSPTTAMAKSSLVIASGAQEDSSILKSTNAIAYEQALAQCRGRRRERNNSLFRPNMADEDDEDLDEGLFIDVEQREFRLSFLRAEQFDTKKAAMRFIEYFEEKRRLFGVENLTTKIKIKDLDVETKNCLESGQVQLLPGRDRAGRAVIVGTKKLAIAREKLLDQNSSLRALWVLCSIALDDLKTENGVVFVNYAIGDRDDSNSGFSHKIRDWGKLLRALPLRVASIHWCVDNHTLKQKAYLSALMLGASNFVRVRCHAGSDMEVQYNLNTFGIPTDLLPVSMTGQINMSRHIEFLRDRKKSEAYTLLNKALALVEAPMLDDFDGGDDELSASATNVNRMLNNPIISTETGLNSHSNTVNNFPRQNQVQFEPEHYHKKQEVNQTTSDFAYNPANTSTMNKMAASSFNNSFCLMGNRSQVQVQSSMQQFQQQQQQQQLHVNGFQQRHLGMNMNMGIVQRFSQNQQMQRRQQRQQHQHQHQNGESKSGISYSMEPVLVPGELDILLGRGRGAQNHKGNIHYRQVVETFRSRYEQIPQKGAKTQLIREVVAVIYDNGGRFLKQDGFGRWIPVDPEVARDKVSHSFRNQKRLSVGTSSPSAIESSLSKKRKK